MYTHTECTHIIVILFIIQYREVTLLLICHESTITLQWQHILNLLVSTSYIFQFISYWGEPEQAPHLSNGVPVIYIGMYNVYLVRHSVNKCPHILIHLNSFDFAMHHQFHKCHHVQIIETASILHVQWVYSTTRSLLTLLLTRLTIRHSLVIVHWVGQLQLPWAKWRVSKNKSCTVL